MPRGRRMYGRRDGRNPYGSRGGYVRDRDMENNNDYARRSYNDYNREYDMRRGDRAYSEQDYARGRRDYEYSRQSDMANDYNDMRDGHYPMRESGARYYPIEAMGVFNGYYGMGEDYARGRDYRGDYDYGYGGDYGENLSKKELEKWNKKLTKDIEEEQMKRFFEKENIEKKAQQMGLQMKEFSPEELATATAMMYSDYSKAIKPYIGSNMDVYIRMGEAFLNDKDASVKGGEKLAVYYDCIVEGEDD